MANDINTQLDQAFQLINDEQLDEAQAVLFSIFQDDQSNADAWWLLANAVTEPDDAREALRHVLTHNPQHPEAHRMLAQLNETYPDLVADQETEGAYDDDLGFDDVEDFDSLIGDTTSQPAANIRSINSDVEASGPVESSAAVDLGDLFGMEMDGYSSEEVAADDDVMFDNFEQSAVEAADAEFDTFDQKREPQDEFDGDLPDSGSTDDMDPDFDLDGIDAADSEAATPQERRPVRRSLLLVLGVLTLILLVVLAVVVLGRGSQTPATPDTVAGDVPTADPGMSGESDVSDNVQLVLESLEQTTNDAAQVAVLGGTATASIEDGALGDTIMLHVCRPADTDLFTAMDFAMQTVSRMSVSVQEEISAVSAQLINCERNDTLLSATVSIEDAAAFASGALSEDEFRAAWQWN